MQRREPSTQISLLQLPAPRRLPSQWTHAREQAHTTTTSFRQHAGESPLRIGQRTARHGE
eukprot:13483742-Alexandrium_andersonii.AAC.1